MAEQILSSKINQFGIDKQSLHDDVNLIYNDTSTNKKVLTSIEKELKQCDSFQFSIAFITEGGLACIKQILDNRRSEITGQIITTDYLNFSDPKALRNLLKFENIKVRVYTKDSFHTKGYVFNKKDETTLIVGSSNLTQDALNKNKEWNIQISSKDKDTTLLANTLSEFNKMWDESIELTKEWIDDYEPRHISAKIMRDRDLFPKHRYPDVIVPNDMQYDALQGLSKIRSSGKDKALLISATGTGKTYLSAFDVKESKMKKVLFLVHREQILDAAIKSYEDILGKNISVGKISGHSKDYDSDFIFSTIQSMSKQDTLNHFDPTYFEYIVCDEAHHSVADQYNKIISYFKPKFMLGMTATPERMDDNKRKDKNNVFEQFNYNIAYEIRLQDALKHEMLCPFHYYGISDIEVDGKPLDEKCDFNSLTSDERVKHIIEKAEFYGHSGDRVKGLIFCAGVDDGKKLSEKLNKMGLKTQFLSGDDDPRIREEAVNRLEQKERETGLDYIVTRDIFNEGVDIKSVNQIIMLRPTQSSTVFIQQLGRGLRKIALDNTEKEYLVVIDFIGNYKNNFLIPIALSGDHSLNKENLRRYILTSTEEVPGCSTVDFDVISKERIFRSINTTGDFTKLLKKRYLGLVEMLGFSPSLTYLLNSSKIDPEVIIQSYHSLNNFKKVLKLEHYEFENHENIILEFISNSFVDGKRPHELVLLKEIMECGSIDVETLSTKIMSDFNITCDESTISSIISILGGTYSNDLKGKSLINYKDNKIQISDYFKKCLLNNNLKKEIEDVISCGIYSFRCNYSNNYDGHFTYFKRYSRTDVCRLLNWDSKSRSSTIYGYREHDSSCPIFVTYNKNANISKSTQYEDVFIDRNTFSWMSRSSRKITSDELKPIINNDCKLYFFIQKNDDDSDYFYYLGKASAITDKVCEKTIENNKGEILPIVNIPLSLSKTVPLEIYDYIVN